MQIVNLKNHSRKGVIYCGRPSALGNPFSLKDFSREEAIENYRKWLYHKLKSNDKDVVAALEKLSEDSILGCWCKPLDCHCDIIIKAWYWWREQNANKKM